MRSLEYFVLAGVEPAGFPWAPVQLLLFGLAFTNFTFLITVSSSKIKLSVCLSKVFDTIPHLDNLELLDGVKQNASLSKFVAPSPKLIVTSSSTITKRDLVCQGVDTLPTLDHSELLDGPKTG